jgi:hypothetical protein
MSSMLSPWRFRNFIMGAARPLWAESIQAFVELQRRQSAKHRFMVGNISQKAAIEEELSVEPGAAHASSAAKATAAPNRPG